MGFQIGVRSGPAGAIVGSLISIEERYAGADRWSPN